MLLVRERPPTRLTVNIDTPDGHHARWAADDPAAGNQPHGLTFATAMPGGFTDGSCILQRDPKRAYVDLEELSDVSVEGVGGLVAWEGRLEQLPSVGGSQAQVTPTCVGWQAHLDDDSSVVMVYIDRNMGAFQGPGVNRQVDLLSAGYSISDWSSSVAPDQSGQPAVVFAVTEPLAGKSVGEAWYDAGAKIISLLRAGNIGLVSADWPVSGSALDMTIGQDDRLLSSFSAGFATGANRVLGPASSPGRYAVLGPKNDSAWGTSGDSTLVAYENVSVIGNHNLALANGPSGTIADDGLLASDVIAHALSKWAPQLRFTTGRDGTIQPSSFVIPQLAFLSAGTISPIIKQAAQYELLDWAVWEARTFYLNARGAGANARRWRARIGPAQLQETGPNVSRIFNGVIVQFTNVDGSTSTVGPSGSGAQATSDFLADADPQNPANQAGLRRWTLLQMGTTTPAAAIQVGQIFLQEQKLLDTSGQATLVGHVQDECGVWWPAWMVRAGDTVTFVDARDPSPRRVVSTSYSDQAKANSIQLDQPPDSMTALLDRLSVVIQPLGFS